LEVRLLCISCVACSLDTYRTNRRGSWNQKRNKNTENCDPYCKLQKRQSSHKINELIVFPVTCLFLLQWLPISSWKVFLNMLSKLMLYSSWKLPMNTRDRVILLLVNKLVPG
jgi:hypothetical protein